MSSANHRVTYRRVRNRRLHEEPFIDAHGINQSRSISVASESVAGTPYVEFPPGQVYGRRRDKGLFYPLSYDRLTDDVAADNVLPVNDPFQFYAGDYVEVDGGYRKITAVDHEDGTITVDGAALTLAAGAEVIGDTSRSFDVIVAAADADTDIQVGDASQFDVGDIITVGGGAATAVTAIDVETNTITVEDAQTADDGALVVSAPDGDYRIGTSALHWFSAEGYRGQNGLVTTRQHGEARTRALVGLTPDARDALSPMVTFNDSNRI